MNTLSIFVKRLLAHLGVAIGIAAVLIVVILVISADIAVQSKSIYERSLSISANLQSAGDLNRLKTEQQAASAYQERLSKIIIDRDGLFTFSSDVKSIAVRNGLDSTFKFGQESASDGSFTKISFQITIIGGYTSIANFIRDLEGSGYLINLSEVNILAQNERHTGSISGTIIFK